MSIQESHCFNNENEQIQLAAAFCHVLFIFLPAMWMLILKMECPPCDKEKTNPLARKAGKENGRNLLVQWYHEATITAVVYLPLNLLYEDI